MHTQQNVLLKPNLSEYPPVPLAKERVTSAKYLYKHLCQYCASREEQVYWSSKEPLPSCRRQVIATTFHRFLQRQISQTVPLLGRANLKARQGTTAATKTAHSAILHDNTIRYLQQTHLMYNAAWYTKCWKKERFYHFPEKTGYVLC